MVLKIGHVGNYVKAPGGFSTLVLEKGVEDNSIRLVEH
jgi:hypothetical protein